MRVLAVLLIAVVATGSAASIDNDLLQSLKRLLTLQKKSCPTTNACSGRGTCSAAESLNNMGYSCSNCQSPSGGFTCELDDPCDGQCQDAENVKKGTNGCQRTSTNAVGFFCTNPSYVYRNQLLRDLEEKADQEPYHSIRMRLLADSKETVDSAFLAVMKKRVLES